MTRPLLPFSVTRIGAGGAARVDDLAAAEEPLEVRVNGAPFVLIMRTPGADRELAAGFLLAERVIEGPDDLGTIRYCTDADGAEARNVVNVTLGTRASHRLDGRLAAGRPVVATSACGVCGRRTIDDLMSGVAPMRASWRIRAALVARLPAALREAQPVFGDTGGLHAAALFDRAGALVAAAQDVRRHNAVDKTIGAQLLMERLPLDGRLLFVSGRTSYEIVQKALVARIPILASVSAPSSLAIDLARQGGLTLLGFVRGETFNAYAGEERVEFP